jgi:hypothetical protein
MFATIVAWFKASSVIFGVSIAHWICVVFVSGALVEYALGRSKNPKYRSIAQTLFTGLNKLCVFAHVDQLPIIKQILGFIAPPDETVPPVTPAAPKP